MYKAKPREIKISTVPEVTELQRKQFSMNYHFYGIHEELMLWDNSVLIGFIEFAEEVKHWLSYTICVDLYLCDIITNFPEYYNHSTLTHKLLKALISKQLNVFVTLDSVFTNCLNPKLLRIYWLYQIQLQALAILKARANVVIIEV